MSAPPPAAARGWTDEERLYYFQQSFFALRGMETDARQLTAGNVAQHRRALLAILDAEQPQGATCNSRAPHMFLMRMQIPRGVGALSKSAPSLF